MISPDQVDMRVASVKAELRDDKLSFVVVDKEARTLRGVARGSNIGRSFQRSRMSARALTISVLMN